MWAGWSMMVMLELSRVGDAMVVVLIFIDLALVKLQVGR